MFNKIVTVIASFAVFQLMEAATTSVCVVSVNDAESYCYFPSKSNKECVEIVPKITRPLNCQTTYGDYCGYKGTDCNENLVRDNFSNRCVELGGTITGKYDIPFAGKCLLDYIGTLN